MYMSKPAEPVKAPVVSKPEPKVVQPTKSSPVAPKSFPSTLQLLGYFTQLIIALTAGFIAGDYAFSLTATNVEIAVCAIVGILIAVLSVYGGYKLFGDYDGATANFMLLPVTSIVFIAFMYNIVVK